MPGLLGYIGDNINRNKFGENYQDNLVNEVICNDLIYLERRTINKFMKDKLFYESSNFTVATEGVILNSLELMERYDCPTFQATVIKMYNDKGDEFFSEFKGSFSGILIDKKNDKKIIFTNHVGDKQIFYSKLGHDIIFGSEINYLLEYYNKNKLNYTLDTIGATYILTYGYMLESTTMFKEIKKLKAGTYIIIENQNFEIKEYYSFDNSSKINQTEEEIIENIDFLFRQAVKSAFEKDKEYGLKHLVGLSGGLDSRMTTWVANDLGYQSNIINYTFSQSDYLDEKIAKEIAQDLHHDWIFKMLDNGLFLKDIENTVRVNSGSSLYYGLAHGKSVIDLVDFKEIGIVHTGQVGGILKGYYNKNTPLEYGGRFSNKLKGKIDYSQLKNYMNEAEFLLKNRQYNGTLQGNLSIQNKSESISPFLDPEFIDYCLKIPDTYETNELFIKWMKQKYPSSTEYIWEMTRGKVTDKSITVKGNKVLINQLPRLVFKYIKNKIGLTSSTLNSKYHMNPLDYWYASNNQLRKVMDNYFADNIQLLKEYPYLMEDCRFLYKDGSTIEKNQVLTLLATFKMYF